METKHHTAALAHSPCMPLGWQIESEGQKLERISWIETKTV